MRTIYFLLLLSIALASCALDPTPKKMPDNFSVELWFANGSVPPPGHYEYVVRISAGGDNSVTMWPGYKDMKSNNPPEWDEPLNIKPSEIEALYAFIAEKHVLSANWDVTSESRFPMPGACDSMKISAGQSQVTVLCDYNPNKSDMIKLREVLASKVRSMVPDAVWERLSEKRMEYVKQREIRKPGS